jgi:tetratricopeptide (TPR) repeat protein
MVVGIAFAVFGVLCWWNPRARYIRFAGQILAFWSVSRLGSKLLLFLGSEHGTLAFAFENEASSMFDISMAICLVVALVLDFFAREGSPVGRRVTQLFNLHWSHQSTTTNLGSQTNIGQVSGDVHIHRPVRAPSAQELDDALANSTAAASPAVREGAFHDQIDAAVSYMKEGKVDVALEFLLKLRKRDWDRMTAREKFRTLANLGHCRGRQEEFVQSLADFREALSHQPSDIDARCYVATAEFSAGNDAEARRQAEEILRDHPEAVYAHVIMLRTATTIESAESLWTALPQTVQNAPPILATLGWKAASQREFNFARSLATKGMEDSESRTEFEVLDAAITIGEVSIRALGNPPATPHEIEVLTGAISKLGSAEKEVERTPAKQQSGQIYYYLACANRLLGKKADAEHSYKQSIKAWPSNTDVGRQYALFLDGEDRLSDAIAVLDGNEHHNDDVESAVLLAHLVAERNETGDKERAKSLLQNSIRGLADADLPTVSNALNLYGLLNGTDGNPEEAIRAITNVEHAEFTNAHRTAQLSNARRFAGQSDMAKQLAKDAVAKVTSEESHIGLWDVAASCRDCGLFSDALSVYRKFVTAHSGERFIMAVLECADRSGDTKALLEFCEEVRSNGVLLQEAVELEAYTREKFDDVDGAVEVLDIYLALGVDDYFSKLVRLRKAVMGIKYGKPELYDVRPAELPSWEEADGYLGGMVVMVLRQKGEDLAAVEYAYALLRKDFGDSKAHRAFAASIGAPGSVVSLPTFTMAAAGCAVQYEALIGAEQGWWILEDFPDAQLERRELDSSHPVAKDLQGRKVGEEFVLRSSGVQVVKARILKIISKYHYRYGEVFDHWQDRFPGEFFVWKVEMQKNESGELDLSPIFKSLDDKAEATEQLHKVYREHPLSIASFSELSGTDAIDAATHLASESELEIRCCFGNEQEYQNAVVCLIEATEVVLCPSAIATLWLIRAWHDIPDLPFRIVVPRGAMEQLRRKRDDKATRGEGFLSKIGEKYVFTKSTEDDRKRGEDEFREFYSWLEQRAEVVSGLALADLPPDSRNNLTQVFGGETAQGIAVAKQRSVPLWTDDLGVAELSRTELGVSRFWTEVVLSSLVGNGKLEGEKYAGFVAVLNGSGYRHSRLTPDIIIAAARKAEWKPEQWPFPAVVKWCGNRDVNPLGIAQIVSFSLPRLWQTAAMAEQAEAIARSLLSAVKQLPGGDGILRAIIRHIDHIFGVDVVHADQCQRVADQVLSSRSTRPLILPGESGIEL